MDQSQLRRKHELQQWVKQTMVPSIFTMATEQVQQQCAKNGLSFNQLLTPFSKLKGVSIPIRTPPSNSYNLQDFQFRFIAAQDIASYSLDDIEALLDEQTRSVHPLCDVQSTLRDAPFDAEDIPGYLRRLPRDVHKDSMPWYSAFRKQLVSALQHQEFHMMDHPVASVIVVSTTNPNPMVCFEQLCNPHHLPAAFVSGQYDAGGVPKFYVLLHDAQQGAAPGLDPEVALRKMKSQYPADQCFLVKINSQTTVEPTRPPTHEVWSNVQPAVATGVPYPGCWLSASDCANLRDVTEKISRKAVDLVERRILGINAQVKATRQGLRNTFKHIWRKPKSSSGHATQNDRKLLYLYDAIESQIRILADLAFMVRDYDLAHNMYRLVRDDYKSDKALMHLGSTKEMMGLCVFMNNGNVRNLVNYMEGAYASFKEVAHQKRTSKIVKGTCIADKCATRTTMLYLDIVRCLPESTKGMVHEASNWLLKASTDEMSLSAGILLEQAGTCLIAQDWVGVIPYSPNNPASFSPMLRKFGFHMVMAGWLYHKCNHDAHASRCYATVLNLYHGKHWKQVDNHLNHHLGKWVMALGASKDALKFWGAVLETGEQPVDKQAALLNNFAETLHGLSAPGDASNPENLSMNLKIPLVDDEGVTVPLQDNASILPNAHFVATAAGDDDTAGTPLFSSLDVPRPAIHSPVSPVNHDSANWVWMKQQVDDAASGRDNKPKYIPKPKPGQAKPRSCFLGEPIFVDVPLRNPLALQVELCDVHLVAYMMDAQGARVPVDQAAASLTANRTKAIRLGPSESRVERLSLTPHATGTVHITGIRWKLLGSLWIDHEFRFKGPKLNFTRKQRVEGARGTDMRLFAKVVDPTPWLGVELQDVPTQLYAGQVHHTTIELINIGPKACVPGSVLMCSNGPSVCVGTSSLAGDVVTGNNPEDDNHQLGAHVAMPIDDLGLVTRLPAGDLPPQELLELPIWIRVDHCARPGPLPVRLLFRYESPDGVVRYLKYTTSLDVRPCLSLQTFCVQRNSSASVAPGMQKPATNQCTLNIVANNLLSVDDESCNTVLLKRVHVVSNKWTLRPEVARESALTETTIGPGNSVSFSLQLTAKKDHSPATGAATTIALDEEPQRDASKWERNVSSIPARTERDEETPTEVRMQLVCISNANSVVQDRHKAKARYDRFRAILEMEGKLPVSIQDVRRSNQSGDPLLDMYNGSVLQGEPETASFHHLLWENPETHQLVDMHVCAEWQIAGTEESIAGQAHAMRVRAHPRERECPLVLRADYSDLVEHDFSVDDTGNLMSGSKGGCEMDVVLVIANISPKPTSFTFNANAASHPLSFVWQGVTRKVVRSISPGACVRLAIRCCFLKPGMFDMNTFSVDVVTGMAHGKQLKTTFVFPDQLMITVNPSSHNLGNQQDVLRGRSSSTAGSPKLCSTADEVLVNPSPSLKGGEQGKPVLVNKPASLHEYHSESVSFDLNAPDEGVHLFANERPVYERDHTTPVTGNAGAEREHGSIEGEHGNNVQGSTQLEAADSMDVQVETPQPVPGAASATLNAGDDGHDSDLEEMERAVEESSDDIVNPPLVSHEKEDSDSDLEEMEKAVEQAVSQESLSGVPTQDTGSQLSSDSEDSFLAQLDKEMENDFGREAQE